MSWAFGLCYLWEFWGILWDLGGINNDTYCGVCFDIRLVAFHAISPGEIPRKTGGSESPTSRDGSPETPGYSHLVSPGVHNPLCRSMTTSRASRMRYSDPPSISAAGMAMTGMNATAMWNAGWKSVGDCKAIRSFNFLDLVSGPHYTGCAGTVSARVLSLTPLFLLGLLELCGGQPLWICVKSSNGECGIS